MKSMNFQQLKKIYQNFQPALINTNNKVKQSFQLTQSKEMNPQDYIQQHLIPVSQLPSQLPDEYIPQLPDDTTFNCVFCNKYLVCAKMHFCGCLSCENCQIDPTSMCPIHLATYGSKTDLTDEFIVYYRQFSISCPFADQGCQEVTNVVDLHDHIIICSFSNVKCPYCERVGPRATFDKHYAACTKLPSQCKICSENIDKLLILQHVEECHPACMYCGERKCHAEDFAHEPLQCVVPGCAELTAVCSLRKHLMDATFAAVHCEDLVQRCYFVETLNLEYQKKIEEQGSLIDILKAQQDNVIELKQQLREATIQKQRIELLNSGIQPALPEISSVLNCQERVKVAVQLFKSMENIKLLDVVDTVNENTIINGLFLPENVTFDINLQIRIQYMSQTVLGEKQQTNPFHDEFQTLIKEKQFSFLSFLCVSRSIVRYLIPSDNLSQSETAVNQILTDFCQFVELLVSSRTTRLTLMLSYFIFMFDIMFGEIIALQDNVSLLDEVVDYQLLQYFSNKIEDVLEEKLVLLKSRPLNIDVEYLEQYSKFFKLPIAKYTSADGKLHSFLQIEAGVATNYDFVITNATQLPFFVQKVFVRCLPPATHFAGRLLIYKPIQYVERLIPLVPANLQQFVIQSSIPLQQNNSVEKLLYKVRNTIQDVRIIADSFDTQAEMTGSGIIEVIGQCQNLIHLEFVNQRIAGHASEALQQWQNLQMLRELLLIDVELCYPSQLLLNFENLTVLTLCLKCTEARKKLYEADVLQLCQQLRNLQNLEELVVSFNNEFALPPKAAWAFADSCAQIQRLRQLSLIKVNLRSDVFNVFVQKIAVAPSLQILDLGQNPIFNVENIEQSCNLLGDFLLTSSNLQQLILSDTRLTSRVLTLLVNRLFATNEQLPYLRQIDLSKNRLTDEDVRVFSKLLLKTPSLTKVNFQSCREISPRGLRSLLGRIGPGFQVIYDVDLSLAMEQAGFITQEGGLYVVQ